VSSFFSAQRGLFGAIAECRRAVALLQDKQTDGDGPVAEVVDEAVTRSEAPEASL
jgi:hypothetical protein